MKRVHILRAGASARVRTRGNRIAAVLVALLVPLAMLAGCWDEESKPVNLVVVGDSLSAGHQNGCTVETQQVHSYAKVLADRAGWGLDLPLIGAPGIRPCMTILETGNPLSITRVVPDPLDPTDERDPNDPSTWGNRTNPGVLPTNLGTPGTRVVDVFSAPPDNTFHPLFGLDYAAVWSRMLDTPDHTPDRSMLDQAVDRITASDQDRDIVIFWLGSNDALWSALGGIDYAVTPQPDFQFVYDSALATLQATGAEIVVANVPDLTVAPQFMPAEVAASLFGLTLDTVIAASDITVGQVLGLTAGDYVPMANLGTMYAVLSGQVPGPMGNNDFLTAAEVASLQADIAGYNAIIAVEAATYGAVHVDVATLLDDAKANGRQVGGEILTADLCGGLFSLDGVHPTNVGYAAVANEFITAMNAGLGLSIPPLNEVNVRASEPAKNRCIAGL